MLFLKMRFSFKTHFSPEIKNFKSWILNVLSSFPSEYDILTFGQV